MAEEVKTEIEVKLGDGSVVKGANMEDAFKNLSEMKVNASNAILEKQRLYENEKTERERIAQELADAKAALAVATKPPEVKKPVVDEKAFSKDTYFQILGEDPAKAQDYLDAYRFGIGEPEKVREVFNSMRQDIGNVKQQVDVFTQQSVTAAFLAQHPEYPQGDAEAAKLLTSRVNELTSKEGFPFNPSTVEFAFFQLVNSDKIKPVEEKSEEVKSENPNPALTGPGAVVIDTEAQKAESMSDKELLALLQSKGMFK